MDGWRVLHPHSLMRGCQLASLPYCDAAIPPLPTCSNAQVSTIWTILLRDFEMELVSSIPPPAYNDMVVGPAGPIMIKYKRKRTAAA